MLAMGLTVLMQSPCPASSAVFIASGTRTSVALSTATTAGRVVRRLDSTWYEKSASSFAATSVGRVVRLLKSEKSAPSSSATSTRRVVRRSFCKIDDNRRKKKDYCTAGSSAAGMFICLSMLYFHVRMPLLCPLGVRAVAWARPSIYSKL